MYKNYKMTEDEKKQKELLDKLKEQTKSQMEEVVKGLADNDSIKAIKEEFKNCVTKEHFNKMADEIEEIARSLKALKEKPSNEDKGLVSHLKAHSEVLKTIKKNKKLGNSDLSFTTKALEDYSDIGGRDYLGQIEPGIERLPVRRTSVLSLFKVDSVDSEYLHYWEENVVTRDAKFVVGCATSTHNTKKTWAKRTLELAKIRDIVDVCIDMLEDYTFVASELRSLVEESIQLKKEYELLLGASANANDMVSIDSISSEFNASNALAPFNGANGFQDANLEQLVDAMSAQIQIFGQENKWMPDTFVMNFADFVRYRNLKDDNGNKLIHTLSDSAPTIAGLEVVTSPIVSANKGYVFDSTKGRIKQRKGYTFTASTENKDNVEHELLTMVAHERLQFYVKNINEDAFMKVSDIAQAITNITKV